MGQVEGKVALVTGAASGIGAASAAMLAKEGAKVVATDIDDSLGRRVVDGIVRKGGEATYVSQDVSDETQWADVIAKTEKQYGGLHVLVSNAAVCFAITSIADMSLRDWRTQTAVNLDGSFLAVKHSLPIMRRSGGGSIILMSSIAGLRGSQIYAGYSATKGAIRLFAKSVAMECAKAGDNIRVNTVHPGYIDTPAYKKLAIQMGSDEFDVNELARASAPIGRAGQAEEIAAGIVFLASDASSYMTASELVMDGGLTGGAFRRTS